MAVRSNQPAGKREAAAERRLKAFELRKAGLSFRIIGERLQCNEATAWRDVMERLRELATLEEGVAEDVRRMELERLDALWAVTFPLAEDGDLDAVEKCRKLSESRRKLLGLDAPTKIAPTDTDGKTLPLDALRAIVGGP